VQDRLVGAVHGLGVGGGLGGVGADLAELLDVGPGAEGAAGAGEDHRAQGLAPGEILEHVAEAAPHGQRHGVLLVRPVQRHHGDGGVGDVETDGDVGGVHRAGSSAVRAARSG
jgi:hypothetical protein